MLHGRGMKICAIYLGNPELEKEETILDKCDRHDTNFSPVQQVDQKHKRTQFPVMANTNECATYVSISEGEFCQRSSCNDRNHQKLSRQNFMHLGDGR